MRTESQYENEFLQFLKNSLDDGDRLVSITPLNGDASERKYFRVLAGSHNSGTETKSFILMKSFNPERELAPFLDIHGTLKNFEVPVPEIFYSDTDSGLLLEEDCGDITLEDCVKNQAELRTEPLYMKAVDILIKMQFSERDHSVQSVAWDRFFDTKKFLEELCFMVTHLVNGLYCVTVSETDTLKLSAGFKLLCGEISLEPKVFTHRDYHSRNIMVTNNGGLKILDFQDARMGPCQYDLVSLLKDSYSPLDPELVRRLVDYYREKAAGRGAHFNEKRFLKIFDYITVQRSLKAVGTFAFQKSVKGSDSYLPFIGPALETAFESMERHKELLPLKNCLLGYLKNNL